MKVTLALVLSFVVSALAVAAWRLRPREAPRASAVGVTPPAASPSPEPPPVVTLDPILIVAPRASKLRAPTTRPTPVLELDAPPLAPMKCERWRPLEMGAGYVRDCK